MRTTPIVSTGWSLLCDAVTRAGCDAVTRFKRARMADLRRRRPLDQQIVKIRISASEVEAGATIRSATETFLSDLLRR